VYFFAQGRIVASDQRFGEPVSRAVEVSISHSQEDRGKDLPPIVHCQELFGGGFVYGEVGAQRSISHLGRQLPLSHLQPSRSEVLSPSDHHHASISLLIRAPNHLHTIETELTSPQHIHNQPDLAPLTRCEITVIRLNGRSVSEQEVVADD
jgi:hypothetical protein